MDEIDKLFQKIRRRDIPFADVRSLFLHYNAVGQVTTCDECGRKTKARRLCAHCARWY